MKQRKRTRILAAVCVLIGLICLTAYYMYSHQSVFTGNRIKNQDSYTLEFDIMNQEDSHNLMLQAGDILIVDFAIQKGQVDLKIGIEGQDLIYRGDKIDQGNFELVIPETGTYTIYVHAKHAVGAIYISQVTITD